MELKDLYLPDWQVEGLAIQAAEKILNGDTKPFVVLNDYIVYIVLPSKILYSNIEAGQVLWNTYINVPYIRALNPKYIFIRGNDYRIEITKQGKKYVQS